MTVAIDSTPSACELPPHAPENSAGESRMDAVFGLGHLHHVLGRHDRERIVLSAIDAGFNQFDLAPAYGDGMTEREVGRFLKSRRDIAITTKFGIPLRPIGELPAGVYFGIRAAGKLLRTSFGARYSKRDFSPQALRDSLVSSLRRLRRNHVDCLLIHEPLTLDQFRALGPTWEELERQQRAGVIQRFGVSGPGELLLEADVLGLIPSAAVRMLSMDEPVCSLPASWFQGKDVRIFGVVRRLSQTPGSSRIDPALLVERFRATFPHAVPVFATRRLDEIKRLAEALKSRPASPHPMGRAP